MRRCRHRKRCVFWCVCKKSFAPDSDSSSDTTLLLACRRSGTTSVAPDTIILTDSQTSRATELPIGSECVYQLSSLVPGHCQVPSQTRGPSIINHGTEPVMSSAFPDCFTLFRLGHICFRSRGGCSLVPSFVLLHSCFHRDWTRTRNSIYQSNSVRTQPNTRESLSRADTINNEACMLFAT